MHGSAAVRKPFEPRDIQGARIWLRSDLGLNLVAGAVSAWKDQITRTDYIQPGGGSRPFAVSGLKGRPKVVFSGGQALYNSSLFLQGTKSVFMVIQLAVVPGSGTSIVPYVIQGLASNALRSLLIFINVGGYENVTWKDDLNVNAAAVGYSPTLDTNPHAFLTTYNGGGNTLAASYTMDEAGLGRGVNATLAIGSATNFFTSIGAAVDDPGGTISAGSAMSADLYEFAVFDRPLSAMEKLSLWGYVKDRYGL